MASSLPRLLFPFRLEEAAEDPNEKPVVAGAGVAGLADSAGLPKLKPPKELPAEPDAGAAAGAGAAEPKLNDAGAVASAGLAAGAPKLNDDLAGSSVFAGAPNEKVDVVAGAAAGDAGVEDEAPKVKVLFGASAPAGLGAAVPKENGVEADPPTGLSALGAAAAGAVVEDCPKLNFGASDLGVVEDASAGLLNWALVTVH